MPQLVTLGCSAWRSSVNAQQQLSSTSFCHSTDNTSVSLEFCIISEEALDNTLFHLEYVHIQNIMLEIDIPANVLLVCSSSDVIDVACLSAEMNTLCVFFRSATSLSVSVITELVTRL